MSDTTVTPEEIAALRASGPWWEWRLHTDEELAEILRKEKAGRIAKEEKERKEKEDREANKIEPVNSIGASAGIIYYLNLFGVQLRTLTERGCPQKIIDLLEKQRPVVIAQAMRMSFPKDHVPFLPVIPASLLSIEKQMGMVRYDTASGGCDTDLEVETIKDIVSVPDQPYYILDIEYGTTAKGQSVEQEFSIIVVQGRLPFTAVGIIALCIHTDVLSRHFLTACGSICQSADNQARVPVIGSAMNPRATLSWNFRTSPTFIWKCPSAALFLLG